VRHRTTETLLDLSTSLCFMLATAVVGGYGGVQVLQDRMTVGGLVAFYTYLTRIFGPTQMLVTLYSSLQRASASIRRVREVLDVPPTIVDPPRPTVLRSSGPVAIELRGVHFAYRDEQTVLNGLNLEIGPGEKVALVGSSGCGKSTVARLLTRMYDPDRGSLTLDGVDLRQLTLRTLRSRVALVPQDPILFDVSLKENLLYAHPDADDAELREVLAMTRLEETVAELPNGWEEAVGHLGGRLSGGQRQRLAIARAILQNPRLLILDEATSALDGVTELHQLRSLDRYDVDRTTIVIAHRLSAIRWAERIVVLQGGRVLADGDHRQLYASCGTYRELCDKQSEHEGAHLSILPPVPDDTPTIERTA
jgi:ABC-type multidrug transport system fused ATPase/permease subunit